MALDDSMTQTEIEDFLAEQRQAIFATNHAGRSPQLSPVWYVWDDGTLYVSTSAHSLKARNIAQDHNVSVCVDGGSGDYRYISMSGQVEIIPFDTQFQREMRYRIIRKYHESDESAQSYFDRSANEENVIIVLRPSRLIYKDFN